MTDAELLLASRQDPAAFRDVGRPGWASACSRSSTESGQRCYSTDGGMELGDARGPRLAAGCAVVIGAGPAGNGHDLVVTVIRKG